MRRFSKNPDVDRSLRHSIKDGIAYSVMTGAGEAFLSAFAVFLKSSPAQLGFLVALSQLLASFAQLLSAWLGQRIKSRKIIILCGAALQGSTWLMLMALTVWLPEDAYVILLFCVVLYYGSGNLAVPQWTSLMADLVPARRRGRYFALRTRLGSVTSFAALVLAGSALHGFASSQQAATGFFLLFVVAFVGRLVSIYHLLKMTEPAGEPVHFQIPTNAKWLLHYVRSPFGYFSISFAAMQLATSTASPFFAVYMLRDMHYTYMEFTTNIAMATLAQFLTLNSWGRIADAFGNRVILVVCGCLVPTLPALWLVSQDFVYLLCVQIFAGFAWAGFNLSTSNYVYDLVPHQNRTTFLAVHNILANAGVFLGAMTGGFLAENIPETTTIGPLTVHWSSPLLCVFFISSLLRGTVAIMLLRRLREVRLTKSVSATQLIFRVSRFNALWGLFFDVVATRRRPRAKEPALRHVPETESPQPK